MQVEVEVDLEVERGPTLLLPAVPATATVTATVLPHKLEKEEEHMH